MAPRCPRSGDAGAAINHPPAPPPRPLPPPTQHSADAESGTGRLERRQAGRPACLDVCVGCIGKTASRHKLGKLFKSWTRPCAQDIAVSLCLDQKIQAVSKTHWPGQKEVWVSLRAPRDPAAWTRPCLLCTSCTCSLSDCAGRCSPLRTPCTRSLSDCAGRCPERRCLGGIWHRPPFMQVGADRISLAQLHNESETS